MNNRFLLVGVYLILYQFGSSQEWFQKSDKWYYFLSAIDGTYEGYREISYTKDTVISDLAFKVLTENFYGIRNGEEVLTHSSNHFLYEEDGIVATYCEKEGIDTIYNFNLDVGDTLVWKVNDDVGSCQFVIRLDSVKSEMFEDENFEVQYFR